MKLVCAALLTLWASWAQAQDSAITATLGAPSPFELGYQRRLNERALGELGAGYLYLPAGQGQALQLIQTEVRLRTEPWTSHPRFQAGGSLGFFQISFSSSRLLKSVASELPSESSASLTLRQIYAGPWVGWQWYRSERLSLSSELGLQIPLWAQGGISIDDPTADEATQNMERSLERASPRPFSYLAGKLLPRLSLIRLTWQI